MCRIEFFSEWFEKRYITLNDLKTLLDYIMQDFAERIRLEYWQYLDNDNNKTSGKPSMKK